MATKKILRLSQVKEKTGLSRSTIYAEMNKGKFPKSICIGIRSVGWLEDAIDQWIDSRISNGGRNVK
ncbi:MAG: AlpA family transcriptional regulator [Rickettsiales bacterium]|nr:AlpA family transcriptional regulator [Rickettsiales bacterium]